MKKNYVAPEMEEVLIEAPVVLAGASTDCPGEIMPDSEKPASCSTDVEA